MSHREAAKSMPIFPIDIVLPWVDGSDPEWFREKNRYQDQAFSSSDDRDARYRDWGLLKYWFRGVEAFAPWVNRVFFVTCGQVPDWLNLSAPKLIFVKHSDYIPQKYLPTFSSHPIELNLHRIRELSEHFIYFNDDMFLLRPVTPDLFFQDGLPVFPNELRPIVARPNADGMANIYLNGISTVNAMTNAKEAFRDREKWFSLRTHTRRAAFYNLFFARSFSEYGFVGFRNPHVSVPILKSTMEMFWDTKGDILDATCSHRFRDPRDVNQFMFRYWQCATNRFIPEKPEKLGKYFSIRETNVERICGIIREQKYPQICLNDMELISDGEAIQRIQEAYISAFDQILPQKSSFEK